jgi:CBS domain-containing protein
MADDIRSYMTSDPATLESSATLAEAAQIMDQRDIGNILVVEGGSLTGILTDRDIAVRGVARGLDPSSATVGEVATTDITTVTPDQDVSKAIAVMREKAVRRVPVVEDGRPVGIVALGDLTEHKRSDDVLDDISDAPANN